MGERAGEAAGPRHDLPPRGRLAAWCLEPSDLGNGATTAGLTQTATAHTAKDWTATRLAAPRSER
ncbi:DUF3052 family protein [Streptomyces sp. NPDC059999]|uniref:DUF3052 family protein n=1 Tax=Streptomyces sp. NPDC059999 TaxID=3347030 RepID=UPI00369A5530